VAGSDEADASAAAVCVMCARAQLRVKSTTIVPYPGLEFGVYIDVINSVYTSVPGVTVRSRNIISGSIACDAARARTHTHTHTQVSLSLIQLTTSQENALESIVDEVHLRLMVLSNTVLQTCAAVSDVGQTIQCHFTTAVPATHVIIATAYDPSGIQLQTSFPVGWRVAACWW
jgi:hypothetical protein